MKKEEFIKKISLFSIILISLIVFSGGVSATTYYVSPTGSDTNDGSAPDDAHAWQTISHANDNHVGGDTVYILPGEYRENNICGNYLWGRLSGNSTLCPKSGTQGNRTVYSGYGDRSQVKIVGSDPVTNWQQCTAATCPSNPNPSNVYYASFSTTNQRCEWTDTSTAAVYETDCWEDRSVWLNRSDLDLVCEPDPEYQYQCHNTAWELDKIDAPGEYYYDHSLSRIYVYPSDGGNASDHLIECSKRKNLFTKADTNYVVIENFTFMHSHWSGVFMRAPASYITIRNNEIMWNSGEGTCGENPTAVGTNTNTGAGPECQKVPVNNSYYCFMPGLDVIGNLIHDQGSDAGSSMSNIGGHRGTGFTLYHVKESLIADNTIWNVNKGIFIKERNANNTIMNNTIFDFGINGILFAAHSYDMDVIGNVIYDPVPWAASWASGISWHGNTNNSYHGPGLVFNDNMTVLHNTVYGLSGGYRSGIALDSFCWQLNNWDSIGHLIKNNFIGETERDMLHGCEFPSGQFESDNNTFYEVSGDPLFMKFLPGQILITLTLAEWQSLIQGDYSPLLLTSADDPLFVDLVNRDFRLDSNSLLIDAAEHIPGYHCQYADDDPINPMDPNADCRHWSGLAPDIGAFEYVSAAPVTCYDVSGDNKVNIIDLALVIFWQGKNSGQGDWQNYQHLDVNNDTVINFGDVSAVMGQMGQSC